jgi:hypothetical protein
MHSGNQHEIPVSRQPPNAEFKGPDIVLPAGAEVAGGHGQLVQIGEKTVQFISSFQASAPERA